MRSALRWRWIFAIGQLAVCLLVVWPIRHGFISEVRTLVASYSGRKESPGPVRSMPLLMDWRPSPEEQRRIDDYDRRIEAPAALNFPAGCLTLPYAMVSSAHTEWNPTGIDFRYWRDLSWPLLGIMFWWSAGKCLEGLLLARKGISFTISWRHPVLGLWEVITGGLAMALGLSFWADREGSASPEVLYAGGVVWILLGIMSITAFWLQRRRAKAATSTQSSAVS
jgi:hypothetical protein